MMASKRKTTAKKDAWKTAGKRAAKRVEKSADGHYVVIDGRRWRATNPGLPEEERVRLVGELMKARRDVGRALRERDADAVREARARVQQAKVALGERGAKWWAEDDGRKS